MLTKDEMEGSPPRMRGQAAANHGRTEHGRITPADAGTRCLDCRPMNQTGDHPRGCGDKHSGHCKKYRSGGSPPRMRGQAQQERCSPCENRITPADAGTRQNLLCLVHLFKDHPRGCGDKITERSSTK